MLSNPCSQSISHVRRLLRNWENTRNKNHHVWWNIRTNLTAAGITPFQLSVPSASSPRGPLQPQPDANAATAPNTRPRSPHKCALPPLNLWSAAAALTVGDPPGSFCFEDWCGFLAFRVASWPFVRLCASMAVHNLKWGICSRRPNIFFWLISHDPQNRSTVEKV